MKFFIVFFFSFCFFYTKAQEVNITTENVNRDAVIYASNNEYCPVSISLELDLTNFIFSAGAEKVFVIPAKSLKYKIGVLTNSNAEKKSRYSYKFKYCMGDLTKVKYDTDFLYNLPYAKGKSYTVFQGYNGLASHKNENALDFTMPEGTEIAAARDGIVVKVVQDNTESCPREECDKYNNGITLYHSDGSFAYYGHIKYKGAKVKVGEQIKQGDLIALSGNTGWSSGPHLHFVCYTPNFGKWNTIQTKFKLDIDGKADFLKEKNTYLRSY